MITCTTEIVPVCAEHRERTRLLYEDIPGCPRAPFFDLGAKDGLASFEPLGVVLNFWSKSLLNLALRLCGVRGIQRDSAAVENLLRSVNLRKNFFAPVMSATVAIADHPSPIEPLRRAAALLLAARAIHKDLVHGCFSPDQYNSQSLEMGQYPNLFSTAVTYDGKCLRLYKSTCTSQITVLAGNRIYSVDFGPSDDFWTQCHLVKTFEQIFSLAQAMGSNSDRSSALMSGSKTRTQAQIMAHLLKNPSGAESLNALRHSFLTLCLDLNHFPASAAEAAALAHSRNPANRWYNSALQIVIFGNSKACLIFNYNAYLDGNVQTRAASEIYRRSRTANVEAVTDLRSPAAVQARELILPVPPELLERARKDIAAVSDHQQPTFAIDGFGRQLFASLDLDAVPAFVAALQLAVFRVTGQIPRIKQLLTMSKYRYMDLAIASVTTPQMIAFLNCMQSQGADRKRQKAQLHAAIDSQSAICRKARRYLPLNRLPPLLAESKGGLRGIYIKGLMKITKRLLRALGLADFGRDDVLISHPRIYDEIPLLGRPGVRLPYLRYFGLHYQIWDDRIVLTWMPSVKWHVSNARLTEELARALRDITQIAV